MNTNTSRVCTLIVTVLLYGVHSTVLNGCSNQSPRWRDLGGDYCFIIEENDTATWIDAVHRCFAEGGSLASFHSADDAQRVFDLVEDRTKPLYIGLWKRRDGTFQWVDKSEVDFTNWYPGEPNYKFEKCTQIYTDNGKWNDGACHEEFGYICSSRKSGGATKLRPKKKCPGTSSDWQDFGGEFCYIIENENKAAWDDALSLCSAAGGSLASFHSFEEISTVLQHTKIYSQGFYIGLRLNDEGEYEWADWSTVDLDHFQLWHSDKMASVYNDRCIYMSTENGQWFDISCRRALGYICAVRKVATCEMDIIGDRGSLQSPNYPGHYDPNEKCTWYITVLQNSRVYLEFLDFQVDNTNNCEKDFVEVLDGHDASSPVLGKFCGYGIPDAVRSSGNKMTVIFSSDDFIEDFGFYAHFERDTCGGVATAESGVITSPHYPSPYRGNEDCTWEIIVPENHQIFLQFQTFELEGGYDCRYDSVVIRDGLDPNDPILGKFCGGLLPETIRSSENKMTVTFVSDESDERRGFSALYQSKDISSHVPVESVSVFQELYPLIQGDKIKTAKERITYKAVGASQTDDESKPKIKESIEVVLQQL